MPSRPFRYEWEEQVLGSDLPPTTRLVLVTLGTYMDKHGTGAFPSQQTLAERSHLGVRTVRKHLELAQRKGWLLKVRQGRHVGRGGSYSNMYDAVIPLAAGTQDPPAEPPALSTTGTQDPPANPAGGTDCSQEAHDDPAGGSTVPPNRPEQPKRSNAGKCEACDNSGWTIAPDRAADGSLLPPSRCTACERGRRTS